jgi:hypothetical protein
MAGLPELASISVRSDLHTLEGAFSRRNVAKGATGCAIEQHAIARGR